MKKITIAIDGYSSCGKSTLAKALAVKLKYKYVDTGAMYRCTTLHLMRCNIIKHNEPINHLDVINELDNIHITFKYNAALQFSEVYLNNENVEKEIRQMAVSENVSKVSAIKEVRHKMIVLQKQMGKNKGIVMEGRDIGTVVFPDADLKLFMTADIEVRVKRRYDELLSKGTHITYDEVKKNLVERDYDDTHRKENPLIKANDAIILDNSDLNPQQQLDFVLRLIEDLKLISEE
ncbi:MAG: (d)CMP kinase [Bacteroidia bacterium]|nr:(d)CMP kinase [Bacteroidia bacterium]MCZ2249198.1 (d)CMP kinase [Bacteroidia bacterium]